MLQRTAAMHTFALDEKSRQYFKTRTIESEILRCVTDSSSYPRIRKPDTTTTSAGIPSDGICMVRRCCHPIGIEEGPVEEAEGLVHRMRTLHEMLSLSRSCRTWMGC